MTKALYEITNIHTGEVKTGYARELAAEINVSFAVIRKAYHEEYNINGAWKVVQLKNEDDLLDEEICREWEEVCKPFREVSEKRRKRNANTDTGTKV